MRDCEPLKRPVASSLASSLLEHRPGEMIEEWPTSPAHLRVEKAVSFSEFSSLYSYEKAMVPANELFYTSSERSFISRRDTVQEATRIRRMLRVRMGASGEDVPTLSQCGLEGHEIVGIEHLVLHNVPKKTSKIRKHHSQIVLQEQEKQRTSCQNDPDRLAAQSAITSEKSSLQARRRADVALKIK